MPTSEPLFSIGVDSYSYHRLLGEIRPGETDPRERLRDGGPAIVEEIQPLGIESLSLQTCFLAPNAAGLQELASAASPVELVLAWGAPNGIEFGHNREAVGQLFQWLDLAAQIRCKTVRVVAGGPQLRSHSHLHLDAARPLREAAVHAQGLGITLALENHGDLTAAQIDELLTRVNHPSLGVCFDSANVLRVEDDPLEAAELLAPVTRMVHLKDIEPVEDELSIAAGPCSVPYGEGVVPLEALLNVFLRTSPRPTVYVELGQLRADADERTLVRECIAWLRDFRAAVADIRPARDQTGSSEARR